MQRIGESATATLERLAQERHQRAMDRHQEMITGTLAPTIEGWLAKFHIRYCRQYDLPRVCPYVPEADCVSYTIAMGMGYRHAAEMAERNADRVDQMIRRMSSLLNQDNWAYDGGAHMNLILVRTAETAIMIYARRMEAITRQPAPQVQSPANANDQVPA